MVQVVVGGEKVFRGQYGNNKEDYVKKINEDVKLPELTGTEKQKKWAEDIRNNTLEYINKYMLGHSAILRKVPYDETTKAVDIEDRIKPERIDAGLFTRDIYVKWFKDNTYAGKIINNREGRGYKLDGVEQVMNYMLRGYTKTKTRPSIEDGVKVLRQIMGDY